MGNDPGFATSSPSEDEEGPFDVLGGLPLTRIEALKEIHGNIHFSMRGGVGDSYKLG